MCDIIGGQEMSNYLQEEGYVRLIQCFLKPGLMLERPESPNALTEQQVLQLGLDGKAHVLKRQGAQVDPIYQLFVPSNPDELGL